MMLLPYLDQMPLYSQYNQNGCASAYMIPGGDPMANGNAKVVSTRLSVLNCPSDTGDPYLEESSPHYGIEPGCGLQGAKSNYDLCASVNEYYCKNWFYGDPSIRRMFGQDSHCQVANIRDGHIEYHCHGRDHLRCV